MKKYIVLFLLPMIAFANSFKVASYNVENLFDMQKNGSEYRDYQPHRNGWDKSALDVKLNNIAQVICDINADIIGLQEIENINALNMLKRRLKRVGCEYRYHAIASKQSSTVKVALLSKFKIKKTHEITINRSHKSRSILEAKIDVHGQELIVFVNHWKSKHSYGTESKRIVYAKALINQIKRLPTSSEYVILGDFNSDHNEYVTMDDKFDDSNGKTGINHILNTLYNGSFVDIATLTSSKNRLLHYNLWLDVAKNARWSKNFYGKKGSIDSIIIPKTMLDNQKIEYKVDSFGVFKAPYLFKERGRINRWELKHHKHTKKGYSDHLPIYATFTLGGAKATTPKPTLSIIPQEESNKESKKIKKSPKDNIATLYSIDSITKPLELKDVKVIFKRKDVAIIKAYQEGRGIMVFRDIYSLDEGYSYDIKVDRVEDYNGLKEVTKIFDVQKAQKVDTSSYIKDASKGLDMSVQNEVYKNIVGVYNKRSLQVGKQKIAIFFKDKHTIPSNGSKIKIDRAHIGHYHTPQMVVYSKNDFKIMEK